MSVKCYASLPGRMQVSLKFKIVPRIGDEVCVPDLRGHFVVASVQHFAREASEKDDRPTVQLDLQQLPSLFRLRPYFRRQSLPPRWRLNNLPKEAKTWSPRKR
jgi:hypothetical protein